MRFYAVGRIAGHFSAQTKEVHQSTGGRSSWVSQLPAEKGGIVWTGNAALTSNEPLLGTVREISTECIRGKTASIAIVNENQWGFRPDRCCHRTISGLWIVNSPALASKQSTEDYLDCGRGEHVNALAPGRRPCLPGRGMVPLGYQTSWRRPNEMATSTVVSDRGERPQRS